MRVHLTIAVYFILGVITAQNSYNYQKRFQVKSGHVEYTLSGMETGTKTIWWDNFGNNYREEINSSQTVKTLKGTEEVKNQSLSIFDGNYYYSINAETMQGTKVHKDAVPDFSILGSGLNDGEMEQLAEGLLQGMNGKTEKQSETVLGYTCDVTTAMGATVYSYKGVTLKSYVKIGSNENTEQATVFEENITVSASKFAPPANAFIEDISAETVGFAIDNYESEEEQGLLYPSGIAFEEFRNESECVRRKLGYSLAMHDASGGEYSSMWTQESKNTIWILVNSLQNYNNWRDDFAGDNIEYFVHNGNQMAFQKENIYDEESKTFTAASTLFVELKLKDAFFRIMSTPQISKEKLLEIFDQFVF
ncbi:MAG: hypothetical protein AB7V36_06780 [Bacteroidales bacterium]